MGDGLVHVQWCITNFVTHLGCYFHRTGALTKFDVFWTFYVFEVKKIVYYSLQWAGGTPTVPWAILYQPSMVCHKYSRSEMHLLNETRFTPY